MKYEASDFNKLFPGIDRNAFSFIPILDSFHEGVMITDVTGRILYMNQAQAKIDDIEVDYAVGKTVTELYRVDEGVSPTIQCLRTRKPIVNLAIFYKTSLGRIVNSVHNIYPMFSDGELFGAVIFVKDYGSIPPHVKEGALPKLTKQTLREVSSVTARSHRTFKNGTRFTFSDIIGTSVKFSQAVRAAELASDSPSPVMLYGETGSGKELFAQSIHNKSSRRSSPYIAVNCAAIPENLLEGILFGTSKGAFTGAIDKEGLIEQANGGTLFLDEVNSMAVGLQAKLLRVLQERKIRRIGALKETEVDLKIISTVNEEPHESIRKGQLRSDLMYRLGVVFITIPPLRERSEDIEKLAYHFLHECNRLVNKEIKKISRDVMNHFLNYSWPGNVRELEHVIEGAMNMVQDTDSIQSPHLTVHLAGKALQNDAQAPVNRTASDSSLNDRVHAFNRHETAEQNTQDLQLLNQRFEKQKIIQALKRAEGNASLAARKLGISPQLMHHKLKRYSIRAKDYKSTGPSNKKHF